MINQTNNKKEEKILQILEKYSVIPTSKIANEINSNYFTTLTFLENLLRKNKIKRIVSGKYVYWELK